MKKEVIPFRFFLTLIVISLFLINTVYALGIRPAKIDINFNPNFERGFGFTVLSNDPDQEYEIYTKGDLTEYVKLSKDKIKGSGTFGVELKLPADIEIPGKHRILIGVRELYDEEVVGTGIGTAVAIQAAIDVYVPYPGKYLEVELKSKNANVGEPIDFEMEIVSRGKEDVTMTPRIEIISDNQSLDNIYFNEREIKSQESVKLHKVFDTTGYNPGKYKAVAIVDYGTAIAKDESDFNIGELVIHLVNYTRQVIIGGLQKFDIEIESGWNNQIDGAYAEVKIMNLSGELINFKTSTTSLTPWQKKNITGYFDSSIFSKGVYDTNITLIYFGKNVGKSSSESAKVEFIEKPSELNITMIAVIVLALIVLAAAIFIIVKYLASRKDKKQNTESGKKMNSKGGKKNG